MEEHKQQEKNRHSGLNLYEGKGGMRTDPFEKTMRSFLTKGSRTGLGVCRQRLIGGETSGKEKAMKNVKRMMALVAVLMMSMAMTILTVAAVGTDGKITITNAMSGQTYQAYLIFTANPSDTTDITKGVSYTATSEQIAINGFNDYFDVYEDADGNYTVSMKAGVQDNAVLTFIEDNIENLQQGDAIDGTFTTNSQFEFSDLTYGYYYIKSSLGALVTIDTAANEATVVDKNAANPEAPEKKITGEDSAINSEQDQIDTSFAFDDSSVGSVESFSITFNATNWVQGAEANEAGSGNGTKTQVTVWNFKDAPVGLDIDRTTVKVFVNVGNDAEEDITNTITDIALDSNTGVLTFKIPWVDVNGNSLYETQTVGSALIPVKVTYDATVNATAAVRTAPNLVDIKYNGDKDLGTATTTTYTYKFKLLKVDEKEEPLEGAEFELYYGSAASSDAPALKFTVDDDGNYRFDPNGTETRIKPTGDNAEAKIIGLDHAPYMLREVVVPSGYNKAADQAVTGLTKETNETDNASTVAFGETKIQNKKGSVLPSTGGIGTTIFYIVGVILVVIAGVLLVTRRRMKDE